MSVPQRHVPTEAEAKKVLSRHLPAGYAFRATPLDDATDTATTSHPNAPSHSPESSLRLLGGDVHRHLYKVRSQATSKPRSASFSYSSINHAPASPPRQTTQPASSAAEQLAPGGFRREFVRRKLGRFNTISAPVTSNFVSFLDLYGGFAGEDLAESSDEDENNNNKATDNEEEPDSNGGPNDGDAARETRPLLGRRKSSRAAGKKSDAGLAKTFFTLLKAFIGTGIMFLPKAFNNGGILFSACVLVAISALSMLAFHLLLQCKRRYGGGYGDLAEEIIGPRMRQLVLVSITLSQLGFVCAGTVFVAENLLSFFNAVLQRPNPLSTSILIALQLVALVPLAFIRNISKLGPAALLADVFILFGLVYIFYYDIGALAHNGVSSSVKLFNPQHFAMTIGSAIFTFEGVGLILPIQSSMKRPEKFEQLLCIVMAIITVIFTSVGVLCYATFGADTQIEVISNYPQDSKLVNAVQFIYSLAVLVGTPVQLFPALRIVEARLFARSSSGKRSSATKWQKNAFRTAVVLLCIAVSVLGANDLDRFVALIGSFACVPLVYIFPAILHYKGVAETRLEKAGDVLLAVGGLVGMVFTTAITVANSFV